MASTFRIAFYNNPKLNETTCFDLKGKVVDLDQYMPNFKVDSVKLSDDKKSFLITGDYSYGINADFLLWI